MPFIASSTRPDGQLAKKRAKDNGLARLQRSKALSLLHLLG
ncbi:hypothetical protein HMPREF0758_4877 [Serratia odorifera DSM 4582]|uniref:Uncharacterized protein n=1 Tax=Serratia odorifera DSM 4582 TaxID=667129 RepID=D4E9M7_SEROD|nr:hypothetical protein HMPREF0758_4877 [Serratia odorifera DSM 4582]